MGPMRRWIVWLVAVGALGQFGCAECEKGSDCVDGEYCLTGLCAPLDPDVDAGWGPDEGLTTPTGEACDPAFAPPRCDLRGTYPDELNLTADFQYRLIGVVRIDEGPAPRLTIEAGVRIVGAPRSALVVGASAQLVAEGTPDRPIVFTAEGQDRAAGAWGGIAIAGRAPIAGCRPNGECEDLDNLTDEVGGDDVDHSSGRLRFVRIEFAGGTTESQELSALSLLGVGSGTLIESIQVHRSRDDGISILGGTVNLRATLITLAGDDGLDWSRGWQGHAQHIAVQMGDGDRGFEGDNISNRPTAEPISRPKISNATVYGRTESLDDDHGVLVRSGSGVEIYSSVIVGFGGACFDLEGAQSFGLLSLTDGPGVRLIDSILFCPEGVAIQDRPTDPAVLSTALLAPANGNVVADPGLRDPDADVPDLRPAALGPADRAGRLPEGPFFAPAPWRGAFGPETTWFSDWAAFPDR